MDEPGAPAGDHDPPLRVYALNALVFCERRFYLEEVEGIQVADADVYAGRTLHSTIEKEEEGSFERMLLESPTLGIKGQMDALRRRNGNWLPYEHKKGRARRDDAKKPGAWETDRVQVAAYAMLLEEATGQFIPEARLRYHKDGVTVRVPIDDDARDEVRAIVERARALRRTVERPPVTDNERLCLRCSLAPVCLPEEERLAKDPDWSPVDLSVADDDRIPLHVVAYGSRVGKSGEELVVTPREGEPTRSPSAEVGHVVLHGGAQISSQAIHFCVEKNIPVSWLTGGGRFVGTVAGSGLGVQRKVRQFKALTEGDRCLALAKRLVQAKVEGQLRFVLRATRGEEARSATVEAAVEGLRRCIRQAAGAGEVDVLLGSEGEAARHYFSAWNDLMVPGLDERLKYVGRTRRPPKDRVSALLGFGYALLLKDVTAALLTVGLEPALGFYHRPRSAAPPLALDLMELFRVPLVDMPVMASLNRGQWDPAEDFAETGVRVWLSEQGRRKLIEAYERRRQEVWRHSVVNYSLSYARMIELEARLLEKEWSGAPGLFARFRLR